MTHPAPDCTCRPLSELVVGVPDAGKRTLLAALPGLAGARFPEALRLCVLDAARLDSPAQHALLKELAAADCQPLFILNKADRIIGPRTFMARTSALLRERGFPLAELYPVCALAARLFRLQEEGQPLSQEDRLAQGDYYYRYGPAENSLSAFAVRPAALRPLGSLEVTPEQHFLALENTGLPALERRLKELQAPADAMTDPAPVGAHTVRPPEAATPDDAVGAHSVRPPEAATPDDAVGALTVRPPEAATPDDAVGALTVRPPEADHSDDEIENVGCGSYPQGEPPATTADDLDTLAALEPTAAAPVGATTSDYDAAVGAATGRPPEATTSDDDAAVGAATGRPPEATTSDEGETGPSTSLRSPFDYAQSKALDDTTDTLVDDQPTDTPDTLANIDTPDTLENTDTPDPLETTQPDAPASLPNTDPPTPYDAYDDFDDFDLPYAPAASYDTNSPFDIATLFDPANASNRAPAPEAPAAAAETAEPPASEEAPPVVSFTGNVDSFTRLMAQATASDCAGILALARAVQTSPATDAFRERALESLHSAYKSREVLELASLTAQVEDLDLPALRALADRIRSGPYTVQTRSPYAARVNERIDVLQGRALKALCAQVETADARTLARIKETLERTDCAEVLKTDYFRRIEARQEALDVETLERITAGAEAMREKDLRAVAVTLEANNWNPKYITAYRHKIDLCREAAIARELNQELAELDDMDRREVLALRERISARNLSPRFTVSALSRIEERLYRMDMLRLMALHNDFDLLDFDGIDNLRAQTARSDACPRAKTAYLNRLLEREEALIIENTDARVQLVRQLIAQNKLRTADFELASRSPLYKERVSAFWDGSGLEQPRDLPIFLLSNAGEYAFTGERFYYKTGRDLAFLPLREIKRFQVMRQHMSLLLQVVRNDDSYLLTGTRLARGGSDRVLAFLNDCVRRWYEPGVEGAASANPIHTPNFETAVFTAPVEARLPDAALAWEVFRNRYVNERLRDGLLLREGDEVWEQRSRKLLTSFGLPENTPLIWFCAASLLGSIREGVALGPKGLYAKESKLPLQAVPIEEIFSLTRGARQTTVTTLRNQTFRLDLPAPMVPLVEDYIRTIQLGTFLQQKKETEVRE